ncbi:NTF2-like domain [Phytophthora cactorum]|nr:NTF2-like domain [Phytophthora cactorum]
MANRNAQELAENVLSLYDVSSNRDATIAKYYLPDAVFTDPIVSVRGVDNIQAQFRVLSKFIKSILTIDSSMVYRLKPFPSFMKIVLRVFSVLELKNGRIASHTDHYDFYSVLANVPFVAFFYAQFRPMFGAASSAVIKRLVPPQTKPAISAKAAANGNGVATAVAT